MPRSLTRIFTARYWVPLALLAVPSLHLHLRAADESIGQLRAWAIARGTEESVLRRPASTVGIVSLEPGILASSRGDFYIEDASGGISVASSAALKFTQGNRVRVTGELWLSDTREPELIASRVEIISHLAPLAARTMTLAQFALPENQGRLVSFRSIVTSVSVGESRDTILVENGQMEGYYRRLLPHSNSFIAHTLPGSDMRLTGILMPPARGHIRIRLRGSGDAELLQPPRLLSANLLLGIAGVFAALVALGGIWVLLLRRSVARATIKIRTLLVKSEESSRLKSEFLANISHEIRTPINGILGMQTLALEGPLDAAQRDCIETAQDSAGHLLAILNDILDFSKAETCHIELHAQPVEVLRFLEETVDSLRGLASRKSIGLELKAHRGLPLAVMADPVRLRQILLNLLNNAIKFTEFGEVVLHVDPVATDGVRFAVVDTGIGIPRDQVGRVLEAFYQVDGSNTRAYGGTGLGLAIADRLIRQMSGQLAIKSEVGVGSDFHFTLPLAQTEAPAQPRQAAPASAQPLVGLTILLAEDNAVNLKLLTMVLQRRGAKVIIATDGQQALDAHASGSADLILMDVQMPVLDGLGATCRIREREERTGGHHTPIIGLTAHVLAGDRERCIAAGMDLYLEKPIDLPQLLNCIEALVRPSAFTGLSESNAMLKATPSQL